MKQQKKKNKYRKKKNKGGKKPTLKRNRKTLWEIKLNKRKKTKDV